MSGQQDSEDTKMKLLHANKKEEVFRERVFLGTDNCLVKASPPN